jgi:hypothetical protein
LHPVLAPVEGVRAKAAVAPVIALAASDKVLAWSTIDVIVAAESGYNAVPSVSEYDVV